MKHGLVALDIDEELLGSPPRIEELVQGPCEWNAARGVTESRRPGMADGWLERIERQLAGGTAEIVGKRSADPLAQEAHENVGLLQFLLDLVLRPPACGECIEVMLIEERSNRANRDLFLDERFHGLARDAPLLGHVPRTPNEDALAADHAQNVSASKSEQSLFTPQPLLIRSEAESTGAVRHRCAKGV